MKPISRLVCLAMALLLSVTARATHIFGIDFYYTHLTGNTYRVCLVVYGDCSGSSFPALSTATPFVDVLNDNILTDNLTLTLQPPPVEVTPVCPAEAGNTTCVNPSGTIPGVTKFVYTKDVTLPSASPLWRFVFNGAMGTTSAGRSNSITNIVVGSSGSIIQLIDTLNNTVYNNSSAIYTTIPTPFYCLNTATNFNPGAVDPDGDVLSYGLVPGMSGGSSVTYIVPYTATAPIAAAPGTFSFSSTTGQLSFNPNIVQKSLVVYNVREFQGGMFVGNTQREMTVVVLSSCTNNPPVGSLTDASGGTLVGGNQLNVCGSTGAFTVHIDPTDADGDTINMSVTGLPTGSTFNVVGNNTPAPHATFAWNTTGVPPGSYTFFVTYPSPACPLSNSQTVAYTIVITPIPAIQSVMPTDISCFGSHDGKATVNVSGGTAMIMYAINSSGWQSSNVFTDLGPGMQAIHVKDGAGCMLDTAILISEPPPLQFAGADVTMPTCAGNKDGSVMIHLTGGTPPYQYAKDGAAFAATNSFSALDEGNYTFSVKDANGCTKDTLIKLVGFPRTTVAVDLTGVSCPGAKDGQIRVIADGSGAPFMYGLNSAVSLSSKETFTGLPGGTYTVVVVDANGCRKDTVVSVREPAALKVDFDIANNPCEGAENQGKVVVIVTGGTGPYQYAWSDKSGQADQISGLANGVYAVAVTDRNNCTVSDTAMVQFDNCCNPFIPNAFTPNGDGNNDVVRVFHKGDMQLLEMSIYNRFGEQVFYTQSASSGWDGKYKGMPAELGVYYYYARVICGNTKKKTMLLKGDITLVR